MFYFHVKTPILMKFVAHTLHGLYNVSNEQVKAKLIVYTFLPSSIFKNGFVFSNLKGLDNAL